jgi:hypothetical protein
MIRIERKRVRCLVSQLKSGLDTFLATRECHSSVNTAVVQIIKEQRPRKVPREMQVLNRKCSLMSLPMNWAA